jgi:AcrR family transcriptional regulator
MESKDHIKEVAIKLFAEKGFDGASVRDIAKEANVNIAMISYYYKSKEALLESLIDDLIRNHSAILKQVEKKNASAYDKLIFFINCLIDDIINNYQIAKIVLLESKLQKRQAIIDKISLMIKNVSSTAKALIQEHNPQMPDYNAELSTFMIHSTLFEFVSNPLVGCFIADGDINLLNDPQLRTSAKSKLMGFMADITRKLIS